MGKIKLVVRSVVAKTDGKELSIVDNREIAVGTTKMQNREQRKDGKNVKDKALEERENDMIV